MRMKSKIRKVNVILLAMLAVMELSGCTRETASTDILDSHTEVQSEQVVSSEMENETISGSEWIKGTDTEIETETEDDSYDFTLAFAGDINFDENWSTMQFYNQQEHGIYDCISQELINEMNDADIMWINNEFTYSEGGEPMEGKAYTFRANPGRVDILQQLGVDIAGLANNHVYDYGKTALLDTFDTLSGAGISYVGAGRNLTEAMAPVYVEVDGKTIAYVAASRAEKNQMTPQATETEPGILRCYDTELFLSEIREAKEQADFVIACVHWGTEYSTTLEEVQTTTGHAYIDAGADAVIGAHSHCLQGFEWYNGKLIAYSLGNYWFNEKTLDTMLLELHISGEGEDASIQPEVIPATQINHQTIYSEREEEQNRIYDYLDSISVNTAIDENGNVLSK